MIAGNDRNNRFNKVAVIGLGYIGLPTAAILAASKIKVIGVDISPKIIEIINQGDVHIVEPNLGALVKAAVAQDYLRASLTPEEADVFIITVPTPFKAEHQPDLSFVKNACKSIAPFLKKGDLIILESTSPVGTTEQISLWLQEIRKDLIFPQSYDDVADIKIAYCPERVIPGKVLDELVNNSRIIGGITENCANVAKQLYKIFVKGKIVITNTRTAEMCKLTENSFRDVNIAFANELSIICDKLNINIWELIRLANLHPRVNILSPGVGVGGHCIAVDPWFIVDKTPKEAILIKAARVVNDSKPLWVINKIKEAIDALSSKLNVPPEKISVALLGLSFKPNIDDLRESPAVNIAQHIAKIHFGPVLIVEPHIDELPESLAGTLRLSKLEEATKADLIVKLVDHEQFVGFAHGNNNIFMDFCGESGMLSSVYSADNKVSCYG